MILSLVLVVSAGVYLWTLDRDVVRRFENVRFSVPSAVYTAPTIVRSGMPLQADALIALLKVHDYGPASAKTVRTGEYRRSGSTIAVGVHAFQPPGGGEQRARRTVITFEGEHVSSIRDAAGNLVDSVAIEPMVLGKFYGDARETRRLVSYDEIKDRFVPAVIAAEDHRFFEHTGIDVFGLMRALWVNLSKGGIHQGGSTITQQLIKNLWLTPDRTISRKLTEIIMALLLERHYKKKDILEAYANIVYFGQRGSVSILGVSEATRFYFGKEPENISWSEAALLAGMIRAPARYTPFRHAKEAQDRRESVLYDLAEAGHLTSAELQQARDEALRTIPPTTVTRRAAYFLNYVAKDLQDEHHAAELEENGLQIHTTLEAPLQIAAEHAVEDGLRYLESKDKRLKKAGLQAALISLDPTTGNILAYVGGRNFGRSQFDRVSQARRQIGSLVKPFVAYAAIEKGYPATSTWSNETVAIQTPQGMWTPENYDNTTGGQVTLRKAVERSMNIPTVRIAMATGLDQIKDTLEAAGIQSPVKAYPALALGAVEASPLEVARAYSSLASLGIRAEPRVLTVVSDRDGRPLSRVPLRSRPMLRADVAYVVDNILTGVIARGTGQSANRIGYGGQLAGKTGTTSDYRDAWFAGFTPNLVTVVWVGSDTNEPIYGTGSSLALPIWGEYMLTAMNWRKPKDFEVPEGVVSVEIDPASGEKATNRCPEKFTEVFLKGTEPEYVCRHHQDLIETIINLFR